MRITLRSVALHFVLLISIFSMEVIHSISSDTSLESDDQTLELVVDGLEETEEDASIFDESSEAEEVVVADASSSDDNQEEAPAQTPYFDFAHRTITDIKVHGNKRLPSAAILHHIPYRIGEQMTAANTRALVKSLYRTLGIFSDVYGEAVGQDDIILHVVVLEKQPVKDVILQGNRKISESDIKKKVDLDFMSVYEQELATYAQKIKRLYGERGYNNAVVTTNVSVEPDNRAIVTFVIDEGAQSLVKKIAFRGNQSVTGKELRKAILTKEDWLLGFLNGAGVYIPDRLEADKYQIEQLYQNRGYLQARVIDIEKQVNAKGNVSLTFDIEEGDRYVIADVKVDGKGLVPDEQLAACLPLWKGTFYSREAIMHSMKSLEAFWGNQGHLFAHVEPVIDADDEKKTVNLSFDSDLGDKVTLNRVNIRGNDKTRDHVIRRQLLVQEGCPVTTAQMEASKQSVESLGYFDPRDGVNWKINRVGKNEVDLDLIVKEAKTGNLNLQASYGGSGTNINSPTTGLTVKGVFSDSNFLGTGLNYALEGSWAREEQTFIFHLAQNWLFEKPVSGAIDLYLKRPTYDDLQQITPRPVNAKLAGVGGMLGYITPAQYGALGGLQVLASTGVDRLAYEAQPKANVGGGSINDLFVNAQYQSILDKLFAPGKYCWFAQNFEQNLVNHPIHPSRGYKWHIQSKLAAPLPGSNIGFYKFEWDCHWFTPLVQQYNMTFHLHSFLGAAIPLGNQVVPYGELYHIGGQNSVRGYLWGEIGPRYVGDSIGAQKAFFWNAEVIMPITPDMDMKAVAFYDGGAGWDNPYVNNVNQTFLTNNGFDYRHSVGVGLRILNPMPVRIDWGFKLDPRPWETGYEVHFSMNYSW